MIKSLRRSSHALAVTPSAATVGAIVASCPATTQRHYFYIERLWNARDIAPTLLGLLLFVAAWLKGFSLFFGVAGSGWLASQGVQLIALETEVAVGFLLLSGFALNATRGIAIAYFALLATVSGVTAINGGECAGCLGPLAINAWWMLAIDMVAIACLLVWRPRRTGADRWTAWHSFLACFGMVAVMYGSLFVVFGSPVLALAWLRQEPVRAEPAVLNLGQCVAGQSQVADFVLLNGGPKQEAVIGGTATCVCVTSIGLPKDLAAGGDCRVSVRIVPTGKPGEAFAQTVTWYLRGESLRLVQVQIRGTIGAKEHAAEKEAVSGDTDLSDSAADELPPNRQPGAP